MTPFGAWDMNNKDTGDAKGDTSFVLSRKTAAYECREDPDSFMCKDVTQFTGDDPNSTGVCFCKHNMARFSLFNPMKCSAQHT